MQDSDSTYAVENTFVIDLDTFFAIEEDTVYRDDYEFLTTELCEELFYQLC